MCDATDVGMGSANHPPSFSPGDVIIDIGMFQRWRVLKVDTCGYHVEPVAPFFLRAIGMVFTTASVESHFIKVDSTACMQRQGEVGNERV